MTGRRRPGRGGGNGRAPLAAAVLVATACTGRSAQEAPLPPRPAVLEMTMRDYRFDHAPVVPRGRVVVRAPNVGRVAHEMALAALTEDFPPIDEQLRGETRRAVATLAIVAPTPPGRTGTLAVDLVPGRYAVVCYIEDPDRVQHFLKGMSSEFRVT